MKWKMCFFKKCFSLFLKLLKKSKRKFQKNFSKIKKQKKFKKVKKKMSKNFFWKLFFSFQKTFFHFKNFWQKIKWRGIFFIQKRKKPCFFLFVFPFFPSKNLQKNFYEEQQTKFQNPNNHNPISNLPILRSSEQYSTFKTILEINIQFISLIINNYFIFLQIHSIQFE